MGREGTRGEEGLTDYDLESTKGRREEAARWVPNPRLTD